MTTREDLVRYLTEQFNQVGCWREYNARYKYWRALSRIAGPNNIIKEEEVPTQPSASDYTNTSDDCSSSSLGTFLFPEGSLPDDALPH